MEGRKKRSADAEAEKLQLTMDVAALENRIRLLTEMEKEYEGFSNAVKLVMQAAEKKALRGVHGPVASLIKTQETYTVALEIALGAGMQNIVVDREEDGKAAIGYLKQRNGGRATFLPMTAVRGDVLREDVSGEYGLSLIHICISPRNSRRRRRFRIPCAERAASARQEDNTV